VLALLALHLVLALAAPAVARALGPVRAPRVFALLAVAPALTTAWAAVQGARVLRGEEVVETVAWVPGLSLELALRLDALSLVLVTLVSGIGTLIFLYCPSYVAGHGGGSVAKTGRFAGVLLGFSGAMLGLVLADDLLLLYVFWEATSVTSYLLVGLDDRRAASRGAALQALLVTTLGGLAMLVGFVMLGESAGTYRISELLADPPSGGVVEVALVLVLLGAFTKSAQLPFHPWLPSAMAAPTPVSAYLHAAAMVKAGVYLVARFAPAFADVPLWRPTVLTVGLLTMLLGGWRALRQHDLKRLLAFGTVSQLGFLMVLVGAGTRESAVAGLALLLAHGFFKSTLFLTVGVVDTQTHTRDIRELAGLGRKMPALAAAATLAGLSMAGAPPLLGFIAKEGAYETYLHGYAGDRVVLIGLVAGSILTFAYTARFLYGTFADKGSAATAAVRDAALPPAAFTAPVLVLGVSGLVLGLLPGLVDPLVQGAADATEVADDKHLALWHGLNVALGLSVLTIAAGLLLFRLRHSVSQLQARLHVRPVAALDAEAGYHATVAGLDRTAARSTGLVQTGSLPVYLAVVLLTLLALSGVALGTSASLPGSVRGYDDSLQIAVAAGLLFGALACARARRRFTAVLFLGAVGYGVAVLYVEQGAPDLALTQFLVETLSLAIFVFVLRRLPSEFSRRSFRRVQVVRGGIALSVGVFVTLFAVIAIGARTAPPASQDYLDRASPEGGGNNVVNVILVDFRGFDTLGEITVVAVAAMGIASLVLAGRRVRGERAPDTALPVAEDGPDPERGVARPPVTAGRATALREGEVPGATAGPGRHGDARGSHAGEDR
jgi:multicomponent Na+:H+ antiporter subunit A